VVSIIPAPEQEKGPDHPECESGLHPERGGQELGEVSPLLAPSTTNLHKIPKEYHKLFEELGRRKAENVKQSVDFSLDTHVYSLQELGT